MLYHQSKNLPPPVVLRSPLGPPNANSKWLEVTFVTFTTLTVEFYSTLKRFYCLSRSASFLSVSTAKYKSHVSVNSGGVVCRGWFLMWSRATATFTQAPVSQCRLWPKQEPVFFLKKQWFSIQFQLGTVKFGFVCLIANNYELKRIRDLQKFIIN